MKRLRPATIALTITVALALVSVAIGTRHAFQTGSHDLRYTAAWLLRHHIDPWQEARNGYPHGRFSPPNYLHLLYLLLLPFTFISYTVVEALWCMTTLACSVAAVWLVGEGFALGRRQRLWLLCLLWMSAPFRVTLEVGQFTAIELALLALAFLAASPTASGLALGASFVKYSFSPVAVWLLLLQRRYRLLSIATGTLIAGVLGVWALVPTPFLQVAVAPFRVAPSSLDPGLADAMTLVQTVTAPFVGQPHARLAAALAALAGSLLLAAVIFRLRLPRAEQFMLAGVGSLFLFNHLTYDYVFLCLPLAYAFTLRPWRWRLVIAAPVAIFWYATRLLEHDDAAPAVRLAGLAFNWLLLGGLLVLLIHACRKHHARWCARDGIGHNECDTLPAQSTPTPEPS